MDPDTEQIIHRLMSEPYKEALNDAVRRSAQQGKAAGRFRRTQTASLGHSAVNMDRALSLAGDLEDDELQRRMRLGS